MSCGDSNKYPQHTILLKECRLLSFSYPHNPSLSGALRFLLFCILAIAEALNCKICVTRDKKAVLDCLDDSPLSARVSLRWQDSGLHVLPMGKLNYKVGSVKYVLE